MVGSKMNQIYSVHSISESTSVSEFERKVGLNFMQSKMLQN